jgi:carbonic anhydrase
MPHATHPDPLKVLLEGNARWAADQPAHPRRDMAWRQLLAKQGQTPFAAILCCADSRVPAELLFDVGIGDLFVVRIAGNTADHLVHQSLEFAAHKLGVRLIMVLGHQSCGAITGAIACYPAPAQELLSLIYPSIEEAKQVIAHRPETSSDADALARESIDRHVMRQVIQLRKDPAFEPMTRAGALKIVGARYDLDSGRVTMLLE